MTYTAAKFEAATSNVLGDENTIFDLDLWDKVTQDVAQYPLHHMTYSDTKFEVDTSNGLGGDAFTRKYII